MTDLGYEPRLLHLISRHTTLLLDHSDFITTMLCALIVSMSGLDRLFNVCSACLIWETLYGNFISATEFLSIRLQWLLYVDPANYSCLKAYLWIDCVSWLFGGNFEILFPTSFGISKITKITSVSGDIASQNTLTASNYIRS